VKINDIQNYLWRAIDHEGEILECFVTKKRDKLAALRFLKKAMKRYGPTQIVVTDKLRSYGAAMRDIGNQSRQNTEQYANNRAQNSHRPFRRRERGMTQFRRPSTLQKFVSTHASVYNQFNHQRHLVSRTRFKAIQDV
jgi:putative transposase